MQVESRFTFSEYLKKLNPEKVFDLLIGASGTKSTIMSTNRLVAISVEYSSIENIQKRFDSMSKEACELILSVYISGNSGVEVDFSEFIRAELLNSFLVYSVRNEKGSELILGFSDYDELLHSFLFDKLNEYYKYETINVPQPFFKYRAINDLLLILHLAGKEVLKLKMDGDFMHVTLDEIAKQLHIGVDTILFESRSKSIRDITKFLINFAESRGLIYIEKRIYKPVIENINRWLESDVDNLFFEIDDYLYDYLGAWNRKLLDKVAITEGLFLSTKNSLAFNGNGIEVGLQLLHYIGKISAGVNGDELYWGESCKMWNCDTTPATIIIMPDFSVVVSQMASPEILNEFLVVGDVLGLDGVYKGALSREAIFNSLSSGVKKEAIYEFLNRWNAPGNILTTVQEWVREFNRVSIIDGSVVVVGDESTSGVLSAHPALMGFIRKIDVKTLYTVQKGEENRVASLLSELGFDIRISGQHITDNTDISLNSLLDSKTDSENFKLTTEFTQKKMIVENYGGGGKYSGVMKELDLNDLHHVVEYAKLMDLSIKFEYGGSEGIDSGIYTVMPVKIVNTDKGYIEGNDCDSQERNLFIIDEIKKIAVVE